MCCIVDGAQMDVTSIETILRTSSQTTRTEKTKAADNLRRRSVRNPCVMPCAAAIAIYSMFATISFFDTSIAYHSSRGKDADNGPLTTKRLFVDSIRRECEPRRSVANILKLCEQVGYCRELVV
jgi:hypothetical protein